MNQNNPSTEQTASKLEEAYPVEHPMTNKMNPLSVNIEAPSSSTDSPLPPGSAWQLFVKESFQVILPALALALTVHLFLAQATIVYGQSMEPSLYERERLIIDKISYRLHPPQRNDIVVLDMPGMDEMLVKRIIGLPGESIEIRNGVVLVDNVELSEPFPHQLDHQNMEPAVLGPLSYFVLGDNRENSNDSRSFGSVQREYILGRVWLRYWPLSQVKYF